MNPHQAPARPRARLRPQQTDAGRLQQRLLTWGLNAIFFICGICAWTFKLKGNGSAEGGLLPYSPLQMLIPLLGLATLPWVLALHRGRIPRLAVPRLSAACFLAGPVLIILGVAMHLRGDASKDALLYIIRWMMPVSFLFFYAVARRHGASPLALVLGLAGGAVVTAFAVQLNRSAGINLLLTTPYGGRDAGYLNHPNQYGILCSTTAPVILYFLHTRRRLLGSTWLPRLGAILLLLVYLLCLFQNLSKTNIALFLLTLFFGSLALALNNPRKVVGTMGLALGLAVFLACTVGLALDALQSVSPRAVNTLEAAFFNPAEAKSVEQREVVWDAAVSSIKARPLTGLGPGKAFNVLGLDHAHNLLLQSYLDAGLPGFLGICLVVLGVFWRTAELLRAEFSRRGELADVRMLRLLSSLAAVTYILANMMSDSFSAATMPSFLFFAVIAFSPESETAPPAPGSPQPPAAGRRRSLHAGRMTEADAV